ncbi:MAG TPA: ferritin family protein, partial [Opitutaceae bacterium]|nr:ferritin family protein [Opitutaceae bacterium]
MAKAFHELTEREILALAVALEEEDGRIYGEFAERLRADYPATATALTQMQEQESNHRHRLLEAYQERFGEHLPLMRRQDIKGFVDRKPLWLSRHLSVAQVRREAETMELETRRFYEAVAQRTTDAGIRQLLGDLAQEERHHAAMAEEFDRQQTASGARAEEDVTQRRLFVLQIVQPALAGLMDGSVSTLAPLFAAAFATRNSWDAFLVGMAASVGAGISMGFAEALSDDGALSGRGHPWLRGGVCGIMTTLGGIGHTLPFLIGSFQVATGVAAGVVLVELGVISWIRHHYMDTPFLSAAFQVVLGGLLVFIAGILIGSA